MEQMTLYALIMALTVASGLADAHGFIHAARV